ncbi:uncharacterized protein CLUP02_07919 [Colletotrichum lupini]|uniref:Uncharacterized protein n=1 Tax=Colletotrichum lupini TaxID=145971 RepID=A0A9Q8WGI8_9PEZI|nr:uncharacterized protein CLUP02_07919 [Colletotrichum lupini]UQC82431.1 hypothetical protein CLUP02_07919 [Colletotrichum lupini]
MQVILLYEREPRYTGRRIAACKLDLLQSCRRESGVACCSPLSVCNVVILRLSTADYKRHSAKTLFSYVKVEIVFYGYPTT